MECYRCLKDCFKCIGRDYKKGKYSEGIGSRGSCPGSIYRIQGESEGKIEELKRLDTIFSLAFSFMAGKILDMDYIVKELKPIDVYKEEDVFDLESILKSTHI